MPNLFKPPQPLGKLEPEFDTEFRAYQDDPSPQNADLLLGKLKPSIDKGVRAYVGRKPGTYVKSHAKRIALDAVKTYDPAHAKLSTHVLNHLKGLRRVVRKQSPGIKVPERVELERNALTMYSKELEDELGREPTIQELADRTGVSKKRIAYVQSHKGALAQGTITSLLGEEGYQAFQPAVTGGTGTGWLEIVYDELGTTDKKIMEWSLGMHGQPVLANKEIAVRLGLTPGAISQRKAKIQTIMDKDQELSPF